MRLLLKGNFMARQKCLGKDLASTITNHRERERSIFLSLFVWNINLQHPPPLPPAWAAHEWVVKNLSQQTKPFPCPWCCNTCQMALRGGCVDVICTLWKNWDVLESSVRDSLASYLRGGLGGGRWSSCRRFVFHAGLKHLFTFQTEESGGTGRGESVVEYIA